MSWKSVVLCALLACALPLAHADTYGFGCITGNNQVNCDAGEAQLFVDVTNPGGGQVLFTFYNLGPDASSITDVYFDDGTLLGIASVLNGSGVDFSQLASPPDLPGGNTLDPAFVTTGGFSADSNPPAQPNGVNPGEHVGILFNLLPGQTFADTIAALNGGTLLRIGIHVQGFADGGSEAFVNGPPGGTPNAIPEPTSIVLLGTVLGGVCHLLRKKLRVRNEAKVA